MGYRIAGIAPPGKALYAWLGTGSKPYGLCRSGANTEQSL